MLYIIFAFPMVVLIAVMAVTVVDWGQGGE